MQQNKLKSNAHLVAEIQPEEEAQCTSWNSETEKATTLEGKKELFFCCFTALQQLRSLAPGCGRKITHPGPNTWGKISKCRQHSRWDSERPSVISALTPMKRKLDRWTMTQRRTDIVAGYYFSEKAKLQLKRVKANQVRRWSVVVRQSKEESHDRQCDVFRAEWTTCANVDGEALDDSSWLNATIQQTLLLVIIILLLLLINKNHNKCQITSIQHCIVGQQLAETWSWL